MGNEAERQATNIVPPRRGSVLVITIDTTARPYDLSLVSLGKAWQASASQDFVFITMQAVGAAVYYHFHTATASDLDETAAVSAGGTAAFANTYGAYLADGSSVDLRIDRVTDRWLILKGGGAGKVRLWASSQPAPVTV